MRKRIFNQATGRLNQLFVICMVFVLSTRLITMDSFVTVVYAATEDQTFDHQIMIESYLQRETRTIYPDGKMEIVKEYALKPDINANSEKDNDKKNLAIFEDVRVLNIINIIKMILVKIVKFMLNSVFHMAFGFAALLKNKLMEKIAVSISKQIFIKILSKINEWKAKSL